MNEHYQYRGIRPLKKLHRVVLNQDLNLYSFNDNIEEDNQNFPDKKSFQNVLEYQN